MFGPSYYLAVLSFIIRILGIGVRIAIASNLWIVVITILMVDTMEATGTLIGTIAMLVSVVLWIIITAKKKKN